MAHAATATKRKKDNRLPRGATRVFEPTPIDAQPILDRPVFPIFDWEKIPMPEAQMLYARLKETFERAGRILNARAMASTQIEFYECFMAGKEKCCAKGTQHRMPARGTDYENGHKDPKTGLITPVLICSENCWIRYQGLLIDERRERNLVPRSS